MKIDIHALTDGSRGRLVRHDWGDTKETACLMSALTGATHIDGCVAAGWPRWLAELATVIWDNAPEDQFLKRGKAFAEAAMAAEARGADWDRCFRDIRLQSVLPIALEAVGGGGEPWRVACRNAVQWSIDHDGAANPKDAGAAWAAGAAGAAEAAWAAGAAWAARAAGAAWAAGAAGAAGAAWAAGAAEAAAHTRIYETTIAVLRGDQGVPA